MGLVEAAEVLLQHKAKVLFIANVMAYWTTRRQPNRRQTIKESPDERNKLEINVKLLSYVNPKNLRLKFRRFTSLWHLLLY